MGCFVCIHCHFYQPPRENPWLEAIESQDSAKPFHDWNDRILAECYRPNGASRILDGQGRIGQIVNNYARISFNFGPTLLSWMEEHARPTYEAVLAADRESRRLFSGHGSALAQAYNHIILPLANERDKQTQIAWGVQDFEKRFKRDPEGMWLPETAADVATLEALSAAGLKFTVLSPYQASRMRGGAKEPWIDLHGNGIDSRRPYRCHLPSGRSIGIFFYDGIVARAVAFDKLLFDGANLARRLTSRYDPQGDSSQLIHIATDGETYGHHHPHGDMALAYAVDYITRNKLARVTNYGEYFEANPPSHEVEILEKTSWSCAHGVERWRSNCGCNSTYHAHWNQEWRGPLREALDWLRDELAAGYERETQALLRDPWGARNAYVQAVIDRSPDNVEAFVREHAPRELSAEERIRVLRLLEMQRHLMLMYTSCGWFFDEPTGPETVQILQYAGRAVQLGEQLFGKELEEQFVGRLEKLQSNILEFGSGRDIYDRFVRPAMLDLFGAAAHYAISSLFDGYLKRESMYCYAAELYDAQVLAEGRRKFAVGRARIISRSTHAQLDFNFAVLSMGDHNLTAGIGPSAENDAFQPFAEGVSQHFSQGDSEGCAQMMEHYFGKRTYSLKSLFRDERQRITTQLVDSSLADVEEIYRQAYEQHASKVTFLSDLNIPLPAVLQASAQFVLEGDIRRSLADEKLDSEHIQKLLRKSKQEGITLSASALNHGLRQRLQKLLERWHRKPADLATVQALGGWVRLAKTEPFDVELWQAQNQYFDLLQSLSSAGHFHLDRVWLGHFHKLGEELGIAPSQSFAALMAYSVREGAAVPGNGILPSQAKPDHNFGRREGPQLIV
jgi:alpha-amylase/alpha-mannosidase (GH57 family)